MLGTEYTKFGRVGVSKGGNMIYHEYLSKKWCIPPETALRTVKKTTQHGVRTFFNTALSIRLKINNRSLRHQKLCHYSLSDTMEDEKLHPGNRYSQLFTTKFHVCRELFMRKKIQSNEAL